MPHPNRIQAARQISARTVCTKMVILSMEADERDLVRTLKAGVLGYLLKDSAEADLIRPSDS